MKLFEAASHASLYAKFRLQYPRKIFDTISQFATRRGIDLKTGLALDVGCGSGQSTFQLAVIAKKCIGVDVSAAQIDCAQEKKASEKRDDIEFMVADAHLLPFEKDHFDLVASATAWHWFDPKAACPEVSRVLKKPGCLAVYGYAPFVLSHQECNKHLQYFFEVTNVVAHPRTKLLFNHYRDVELPFPVLERHDMTVPTNFKVSELTGLLQSTTVYRTYCDQYSESTVLHDLSEGLKKAVSEGLTTIKDQVEDPTLEVMVPMCLLLCINVNE